MTELLDQYDYSLPSELIAKTPAQPRDTSRLFVYNTQNDCVHFDYFYNLSSHLPQNSFLILNDTKVLPSRLTVHKQTGGKVILLFLFDTLEVQNNCLNKQCDRASKLNVWGGRKSIIRALADRKVEVGDRLFVNNQEWFKVMGQQEHVFTPQCRRSHKEFLHLLDKNGKTPIPHYLKDTGLSEKELRKKYQTIFAKKHGSSAAPTASLHFTQGVFDNLQRKGIETCFVTLHVGLGTFAPVTDENIVSKKLHEEIYEVSKDEANRINNLKQRKYAAIAVGTTAVRTVESCARGDSVIPSTGTTQLFISPPYKFNIIDGMITNFHLSKTSLMMLVDAFLKYKKAKRSVMDLYRIAIQQKFRFYSFGDTMLII